MQNRKIDTQKIEPRLEQVGTPVAAGGGVDFLEVREAVRQAVAERAIVPAANPGGAIGGRASLPWIAPPPLSYACEGGFGVMLFRRPLYSARG